MRPLDGLRFLNFVKKRTKKIDKKRI